MDETQMPRQPKWTADDAASLRRAITGTDFMLLLEAKRPKLPKSDKSTIEQTAMAAREQDGFDQAVRAITGIINQAETPHE